MDMSSETPKSKRTLNWNKDEIAYLLKLIEERKKIIKGKFSPTLTVKHKKEAWQEITDALNATVPDSHRRTKEQVEKKWHNIMSSAKKSIYERKRKFNQTG